MFYLVTPWYGVESGGAERAARWLAEEGGRRGFPIHVLTTTLGNPFEAGDTEAFRPGETTEHGLSVTRFRPRPRSHPLLSRLVAGIEAGDDLSADDEEAFFRNNISSEDLESFIGRHPADVFVFVPYCFGTTVLGLRAAKRGILIPCLHDEPSARLGLVRSGIAKALGIVFLSEPERKAFQRIYGTDASTPTVTAGLGFGPPPQGEPESFYGGARPGFDHRFLLMGRRHRDKGIDEAIRSFRRLLSEDGFSKVGCLVAGMGESMAGMTGDPAVLDVGFLSENEKWDALAGCTALVLPSRMESFSISLMEAWLAGRPALVWEDCAVTRHHVERADGGLWYGDYPTFAAAVKYFITHPRETTIMGQQGKDYVLKNYNTDKVIEEYVQFLTQFAP